MIKKVVTSTGCNLFFVFINATYEGADANTPIAEALLLHAEAALLQIEALPLQLKVMLLALKALLLSLKALLLPVFIQKQPHKVTNWALSPVFMRLPDSDLFSREVTYRSL